MLGATFGRYISFVRQKAAELCPLETSHHGLKTRQNTNKRGVFDKKTTKNVKISLSISFRLLKMYCDTFELSFDVRCKVKFFARRLACIAALYDKKRLSYAHSNLLTMVSKLGKTHARGAFFLKKMQKT